MELDGVRKELNKYDAMIKNLITLRMSLIPIVADIKIKNDLPLYQGKREEEIYRNIAIFAEKNGVDGELVKQIYQLMIANALKREEEIAEKSGETVLSQEIDLKNYEKIKQEFQKLDELFEKQIPEILEKITKECEKENINLSQIATIYYNQKNESGL